MGKSLYFKFNFIIFGLTLLVCSGCRILLKLFHTDVETGFYTLDSPLIMGFNITLLCGILGMLVINRLKTSDNDFPLIRESRTLGFIAICTGVTAALYVLENTGWMRITTHPGTPLKGVAVMICGVLGILASLSIFTTGLAGVFFRRPPGGLIAVFPSLWLMSLLVLKFNNYTTVITVADHLLAVLFMVFACIFIVGHARTICGFARKDGRNYTIPTGLITSILGLLLAVPNLVYAAFNRSQIPTAFLGDMECLFVLFFSIYSLAAVIELRRSIASV